MTFMYLRMVVKLAYQQYLILQQVILTRNIAFNDKTEGYFQEIKINVRILKYMCACARMYSAHTVRIKMCAFFIFVRILRTKTSPRKNEKTRSIEAELLAKIATQAKQSIICELSYHMYSKQ
ncbi:Hypothetical_protein [Hexamita inflata]|uniref:Hypothetical_protein n=1 Tax=Hexamita inflata TaxID=28002 RepID=A0AA86UI86_9EUKA|nr:Hypothetical protein HINF_LOCUS28773 [Hexamita inflata]